MTEDALYDSQSVSGALLAHVLYDVSVLQIIHVVNLLAEQNADITQVFSIIQIVETHENR